MKYIKMSIEDAKKYAREDAIILLAIDQLEKSDCNIRFVKKTFGDCIDLIEKAETIAKVYDEFINQLRVFSKKQIDVLDYEPRGELSTILFESNYSAQHDKNIQTNVRKKY